MLARRKKSHIIQTLTKFPAVVLVGPRQCGKTTLARSLSQRYYDLELESDRLRIDLDWPRVCSEDDLIVLDEAQTFPELFPRIRAAIDSRRSIAGRFLILGSTAPSLMHEVSESLAGRAAVVELTPLSLTELSSSRLDDLWLYGGFPEGGILDPTRYPVWEQSYLELLIQRDLPNLGLPAKPLLTERMLRMIAALHGQEWNASKLGGALGINYQTVNSYLEFFHGTFLTRAITPFETNLKKRIVKHPKIYLRDSGLLHALLGVQSMNHLLAQPWVGASWEGFVIEQILAALDSSKGSTIPHFIRSGDAEIDLILQYRGEIWAFEIKLTTEPSRDHTKHLISLGTAIGAQRKILIHRGTMTLHGGECELIPLEGLLNELS
jgi:predicted AAA+ superfamily ATPase